MMTPTPDRYDQFHFYGDVKFYLASVELNIEESRCLLLKVIEQAVRDYITLFESTSQNEKILWEQARGFIFDDEYQVDWGRLTLSTTDIMNILDLDVDWFREITEKKFRKKYGQHN